MTDATATLKADAEYYRELVRIGAVSYEVAKEHIMPYLNAINEKAKELAKKYGMKPKVVSLASFLR